MFNRTYQTLKKGTAQDLLFFFLHLLINELNSSQQLFIRLILDLSANDMKGNWKQ